jgi:phosphopantetheinyl transferase (holo-ACP synthase)
MVGDDVIDLGDPETRPDACHARFDARVFDASELRLLAGSETPVRLRWILWAAKEAAYKVAKKHDRATVFSPVRFVVQPGGDARATVQHEGRRYAVALEVGARFVHAVATAGSAAGDRVVARVERLGQGSATCPGSVARALAIRTVAPLLGLGASDLAVARDGRIPRLQHVRGALTIDLSLSHHGHFVSFACALPSAHAAAGGAS